MSSRDKKTSWFAADYNESLQSILTKPSDPYVEFGIKFWSLF